MPDGARRAAERAGVCAEHLARLVDDVLLLTTAEIGRLPVAPGRVEPRPRSSPASWSRSATRRRPRASASSSSWPTASPCCWTDPQRLRQLLVALLSNAVKFTSRGEVRLTARLAPAPHAAGGRARSGRSRTVEIWRLRHRARRRAGGPERIFAPFEQIGDPARSDSMLRGTGLGLTIARQLPMLLHGTLVLAHTSPHGLALLRAAARCRSPPDPS